MVFFFRQKSAYKVLRSLVGSEMCIGDSFENGVFQTQLGAAHGADIAARAGSDDDDVILGHGFGPFLGWGGALPLLTFGQFTPGYFGQEKKGARGALAL